MSTWISRILSVAVLAVTLSGCDEASGLPFSADFPSLAGTGSTRLAATRLADGAVTVVAPDGYCIDRRSVTRRGQSGFALIARCDTLGVRGSFDRYALAIITVTTMPRAPGTPDPTAAVLAQGAGETRVLERRSAGGAVLVRLADGPHEIDGVARTHWRGAFAQGSQLVGLSLYAPEGSAALGSGGARLLGRIATAARASREAAAAQE